MTAESSREKGFVCQVWSAAKMQSVMTWGDPDGLPLKKTLRLAVKRRLSLKSRRKLKLLLFNLKSVLFKTDHKTNPSAIPSSALKPLNLTAGDQVRVRTREEIQATLDSSSEMKGCAFLGEMWQYCGSNQRVFKRVERFVDERDYQVKKIRGVVLLEGVLCGGTEYYGKCDRSCFYFWREEWLEKIEG